MWMCVNICARQCYFLPGYQIAVTLLCLSSCLEISTSVWTHSVWSRYKTPFSFFIFYFYGSSDDEDVRPPGTLTSTRFLFLCFSVSSICPSWQTCRPWRRNAAMKWRRSSAKKRTTTTRWIDQFCDDDGPILFFAAASTSTCFHLRQQVLLHIEEKRFAYRHQAVFREDDGRAVRTATFHQAA